MIDIIGAMGSDAGFKSEYHDPRWRSFASRIVRAHPFCNCCKRVGIELQAHHACYEPGCHLWESDPGDMIVLCRPCHEELTTQLRKFRKHIFKSLGPRQFELINGALAVALDRYDPLTFCHALCEFVSHPTLVEKYSEAWK